MVVLLVMIQVFYCTNTREYTNIPSCRGKLVLDLSRLEEGIFVYTLVKLYNKANLFIKKYKCTCKANVLNFNELKMITGCRI